MGGESFDVCDMLEVIHSEGAEILAEYSSDFYAGGPALTKNSYGNGTAYYQAFRDTGALKDRILGEILDSLSIKGAVPKQDDRLVTAHTRVADGETYIFLENYSSAQKCVDIGYPCLDMETGEKSDSFTVPSFGCRVLKKYKED
jgi:beta-galactosidase